MTLAIARVTLGEVMESLPIDLDALLAPLPVGEQGVGVDLRADYSATSPYQRLRDARASARAEERARDADGDSEGPEAAGWRDVLSIGQQVLASASKDVEIAAWMTEALVRIHDLPGATAGALLMKGLCEQYWDQLFPLPDEDGFEGRASPIGGLAGGSADGTIMQPLRNMALFRRTDGTGIGVYVWEQVEQMETLDPKRKKAKIDAGTPEFKTLEAEGRADKGHVQMRGQQVMVAMEAWRALDQQLEARMGSSAPSVRKVITLLERMLEILGRLGFVARTASADADAADAAAADDPAQATAAGGAAAAAVPGALVSREAALKELDRIADFFRRTEPHSPLAYTLEEATRRGRMTLAELLDEVLPEAEVRKAMLERLGIRIEPTS
jgi:type VI secretion system protein ImpA